MKVTGGRGVNLDFNDVKLCIDGDSNSDLTFISHAHMDHLVRKPLRQPVIASRITKDLCFERTGLRFQENLITDEFNGLKLKMIDNGHVAGSKALLIEGDEKVLYTGDFSLHDRFFMKGFKPPKCDVLIIETTYGSSEYKFPDPESVLKQAASDVSDYLSSGKSVVLMGYALGKAQLVSKLVEDYDNVFAYKSVRNINGVLIKNGVPIKDYPQLFLKGLSEQFIALCPQYGPNNPLIKDLRKRGAVILAFTGWANHRSLGADKSYELSDHADFIDLLKTVKACNPSRIFTHHGYASEFAELLRLEDFDAKPI